MKIEYVKNPVWANPEHSLINLVIKWNRFAEELPFTADPNDPEEHGRALFASALAGEFGEVAEYVAPVHPEPEPGPTPSTGDIPVTEA
jgi:hypothetical protein